MIYFFINITMYLIIIIILVKYFYNKMTITSFIIIIFNMNVFFFFIYKDINFIYGLLFLIVSLILYYFINMFNTIEREIILIKDGRINFHEVINNYSYSKLIKYLKKHHIKLEEVSYCLKRGRKITIIKDQKIY